MKSMVLLEAEIVRLADGGQLGVESSTLVRLRPARWFSTEVAESGAKEKNSRRLDIHQRTDGTGDRPGR